jgi:CubicO group peptidase (beta-lactamase class C family)
MSLAERIDRHLAHLEAPGMPGAAVAVLVDGEVVHRRGYGRADIAADVAMTPSTLYPIASMTKQFTTTCILLLEGQGRLALGDDYRRYLPEMPDFGTPITINHLCTNTSGVRDIFALVALAGGDRLAPRPRELVMNVLGRQRTLNFPVGSQYRYCNPNFQMLSWIVERVTGQRLGEVMAERIFVPLGMASTFLQDLREPPMAGGARAYDGATRDELALTEWDAFARGGSGEGGGAIWSTLDDLILWEQNFAHNVIGSPGLLDRLAQAPQLSGRDPGLYGRGLFVGSHRGLAWQGHSGGLGPYTCNRVRFPDAGVSVIMLSNSALASPFLGVFDIADAVLDQRPGIEPSPVWEKAPAQRLAPWLGAYEDPATGVTFELCDRDGTATLVWFGSPVPLESDGGSSFLAMRGASLPTTVTCGAVGPIPEITIQLGPNPPIRLRRAAPQLGGDLDLFEGRYYSDELEATYTVSMDVGNLSLAIDGPLGSRHRIAMSRLTESSFTASLGPDQNPLLHFPHAPGRPPVEVVVTLARAEGLRLRRDR